MPDRDIVERARTLLEGVTEGPWLMIPELGNEDAAVMSEGERAPDSITVGGHTFHPGYSVAVDLRQPDGEFVAAARSLVPELVAELERLRQQRTITDVADLDALPNRSVIRAANGDYFEKSSRGGWDCLSEDGTGGLYVEIDLPAIVLWLPEWGNK